MWAKHPRGEVKQPRGDEVGWVYLWFLLIMHRLWKDLDKCISVPRHRLQEQSSEGSGNVQTLLPKSYLPGQR